MHNPIGRNPTSATSEEGRVNVAKNSMPWQGAGDGTSAREQFKYTPPPLALESRLR